MPWFYDLEQNYVSYKYFPWNAVEIIEETIPSPGWHQIHQYSSTNYNLGISPLHVGEQPSHFFEGEDNDAMCEFHGLFEFNIGHGHCHFDPYNFNHYDINGVKAMDNSKRGFCIISVSRLRNDETTPLYSPYNSCGYQGMSAGWGDLYQGGITGQAKIVTGLPVGLANYTVTENYWNALCEGHMQCNASDTNQIMFEHRHDLSDFLGRSAESWICRTDPTNPQPLENNAYTKMMWHSGAGQGYVTNTSIFGPSQEIGPLGD